MGKTKRYFTQRELEKHINARLMRERKKTAELEALKTVADTLLDNEDINASSYAEAAVILAEMIADMTAVKMGDKKTEIAEDNGKVKNVGETDPDDDTEEASLSENEDAGYDDPVNEDDFNANSRAVAENLTEIKAEGNAENGKEKNGEPDGKAESEKTIMPADSNGKKDISGMDSFADETDAFEAVAGKFKNALIKNHPDDESATSKLPVKNDIADKNGRYTVSEDIRNGDGKSSDIPHEMYENTDKADVGKTVEKNGDAHMDTERLIGLFRELIGVLEGGGTKASKEDNGFLARRDICSTGFSKASSENDLRLASELTSTQREIARRAGLSYREYAELLREIPENTRKRKKIR